MRTLISCWPYCLLIALSGTAEAQNIGINATGAAPNASAMLDIDVSSLPAAGKRGLLIPRMTSTERTSIAAPATGLLVYDQTTASFWYRNASAWVELFTGTSGWALAGNTLAGTEKLGSVNGQPVRFFASNAERMRLLANGQLVVNNTVAFAGDIFSAYATAASNYALNGYCSGNNGYAIYGEATGTPCVGVVGAVNGAGSVGVHGEGLAGTSTGVEGLATQASSVAIDASNTATAGTGLTASGNNLGLVNLTSGSGIATNGTAVGLFALGATAASGTGVLGVGNNLGAFGSLTAGCGVAGNGVYFGVYGVATSNAAGAANAPARAGGYFVSGTGGNQSYTYVGCFEGAGVPRKVMGNGTVNTIVEDAEGRSVLLSAPEAPENLFQDYGTGRLTEGHARIALDPTFARNIQVDEAHPLRVFVQLRGDCRGVYVNGESADGFDVTELQHGTSDVAFTWTAIGNRADRTLPDGTVWRFAQERFTRVQGPQPTVETPTQELPLRRASLLRDRKP